MRFPGRVGLCMKYRAGIWLKNTEPSLKKNRLRGTAHFSTLVESWSGPRWAGVSENGSERAGGLGSPQSLPEDLAMRSTVLGSLVGCITKRAESREPRAESSVHGEARRLDHPRPHGRTSSEATPTFPPPPRRRRPHGEARRLDHPPRPPALTGPNLPRAPSPGALPGRGLSGGGGRRPPGPARRGVGASDTAPFRRLAPRRRRPHVPVRVPAGRGAPSVRAERGPARRGRHVVGESSPPAPGGLPPDRAAATGAGPAGAFARLRPALFRAAACLVVAAAALLALVSSARWRTSPRQVLAPPGQFGPPVLGSYTNGAKF